MPTGSCRQLDGESASYQRSILADAFRAAHLAKPEISSNNLPGHVRDFHGRLQIPRVRRPTAWMSLAQSRRGRVTMLSSADSGNLKRASGIVDQ